jgi:Zn-dependent protease
MSAGPWGARDGSNPALTGVANGRPPRPPAGAGLVWNLVSTLLLAGFLAISMGPIFALAGVVGVLVHEVGHVIAMNLLGCGPARIVIIPFLGGAAVPARRAESEFKDVVISLAGPVFGLLAMGPFVLAWSLTGDAAWFGGAFFVAFINLLNLAPAPPLDGSKAISPVLARIHPLVERAALAAVGALAVLWAFSRGSWLLAAFLGIGLLGSLKSGRTRPPGRPLEGMEFLWSILLYAAAAALCVLALAVALNGMGRPISPQAVLEVFR